MSSIITGEAVVLELRPASFAARALGLLLDVLVHAAALWGLLALVGAAAPDLDRAALGAVITVAVVFCFVVLPVAVETLSRGLSLGKLAAGLRIVRDDGGSIRFRHALIRGLIGFLEIYATVGGLAVAVALFNGKSKRLGDLVAGTYALRRRVRAEAPVLHHVPFQLQPWASLADIGRIPDAAARRASLFLRQCGRMAPGSRVAMAQSLASELAAHVAPPPPPGTSPEDYLAAVLGERSRRELDRLRLTRERSARLGARLGRLPHERGR
ncbi:RDD family protein [Pseudarthrobacter sp. B907]|uniref:RDD family protein n=1 Tax=Pseudarthrobacter sp. B907 TaxID=3158261 RepID=UPI0032DB6778